VVLACGNRDRAVARAESEARALKFTPRVKLVLLASLFALPMIASVIAYVFFPPPPSANYGELLLPPQVLSADLRARHGERWLMIATTAHEAMPQVRLALGRDASRVEVVVAPRAELEKAGMSVDERHIYLADPHGNVMMRWPASPDRKRMLEDLKRLLRASQIG
jgi:hypothetical protein